LSDGLRVIVGAQDTIVMSKVSAKVNEPVVYFDHEDQIGGARAPRGGEWVILGKLN
jgi:hypothetical protein